MVRGNGIDGPVQQSFDKGFPVPGAAERGIHLEAAFLPEVVLAKDKVMRCCFAGDPYAGSLGFPDEVDALPGGNVTDMVPASGFGAGRRMPPG